MSEEIDNLKEGKNSFRKKMEDRMVGLEQYLLRNNLHFFWRSRGIARKCRAQSGGDFNKENECNAIRLCY